MSNPGRTLAAVLAFAAIALATQSASAVPTPGALADKTARSAPTENVRYAGGWGWGAGAGFAAGAIIGGALAAPYYYGGYRPYYPAPVYYYADPLPPGGAVDYCMRRYRSYDPRSGTYVGYDGYRRACP